jgi:GDP-4-dehydro-6-deoxy-D-mannose reductase
MRVLITGASGFVGRHLTEVLRERGEEVIEFGLSNEDTWAGITIDLCDADAVANTDLRGIDAVIHLAGLAQVSRSFAEPSIYVAANTAMEINLCEALLTQDLSPRILIVSSGGVYSGRDSPITEDSAVDASSPYVVSKLAQEMLASYYGKRGLEVVVARPFNHIGPGQQTGYLVSDLCSQIAELERRGAGTLAVGNLSSSRDYTDVRDVAAAYHSLIRDGEPGEIYNVCSGTSRSGEQILSMLRSLTTVELPVTQAAALNRPTDPDALSASNEKLRRHTGWAPSIPLEQTLRDTLDYWRNRPSVS